MPATASATASAPRARSIPIGASIRSSLSTAETSPTASWTPSSRGTTKASTTRPRPQYDAPAPTVRRAHDDLDGLHYILHSHMEELSQTQREIIVETYFEGQSREEIAARRGISLSTYDNHRKAACQKLRDSLTAVADFSTDIDLPDWFDRVGEMSKRHAARLRRRASREKVNPSTSGGDRSNSRGDRSNFEGDRSYSRGDADKNAGARDLSVAVTTKS